MKDNIYFGSMFGCNGIIVACLTFALNPDFLLRTLLLMWAGYMFGFGLVQIFKKEMKDG